MPPIFHAQSVHDDVHVVGGVRGYWFGYWFMTGVPVAMS